MLLEKVLDQMFSFKVDPKRFEILKEQYYRTISNFKAEAPYQHAVYYLALILTEFAWTKEELLDAFSCKFYNFFKIELNFNVSYFCSFPP